MKPDLIGENIILRSLFIEDSQDLFEIYGCTQTMEFASDPVFESLDTVLQMLESVKYLEASGSSFEWGVMEKHTGKIIGTCGFHSFSECGKKCEVGCLLNSKFWRRGYMREALTMLFGYAKSKGIKALLADVDVKNFRAIGLFCGLGFKAESGFYTLHLDTIA